MSPTVFRAPASNCRHHKNNCKTQLTVENVSLTKTLLLHGNYQAAWFILFIVIASAYRENINIYSDYQRYILD